MVRRTARIGRELVRRALADPAGGLAAQIAFYAVFGLFPGLMLLATALGWLDFVLGQEVASRSERVVIGLLNRALADSASGVVAGARELFSRSSGKLLTTALVVGLWTLARGASATIEALDVAYGVPEKRSWASRMGMGLILAVATILMLVLVLAMAVLGPLFGGGGALADAWHMGGAFAFAWNWLRPPLAFLLLVVWATTLYRVGPNHSVAWRLHLPGGFLAAFLWLALSYGLRLSVQWASGGNPILRLLGGGLTLLLWLYLLALALVIGGMLNSLLNDERRDAPR